MRRLSRPESLNSKLLFLEHYSSWLLTHAHSHAYSDPDCSTTNTPLGDRRHNQDRAFSTSSFPTSSQSALVLTASAARRDTSIALPLILGLGICLVMAVGIAYIYFRLARSTDAAASDVPQVPARNSNEDDIDIDHDVAGTRSPPATPDPIPDPDADPLDESTTPTLLNF
ncbi:hypothetical protein B0H11DRAFT_2269395 [Mycena galericulata]|nr:hypothetical protein B0H11DRAFT_1115806 [Mycena galericulata]KAJ7510887.1 hypothetical protein B0H11DRAFT_2269395 [Mycena galericulata]